MSSREARAESAGALPPPTAVGDTFTLVFIIAGLTGGGAERVLSILASEMAERGHRVMLLTLGDEAPDFYSLHPLVERVRLDLPFGERAAGRGVRGRALLEFRLLRSVRRFLRHRAPDAVISFSTETNARVLLATLGARHRIIVSERSDPASIPLTWIWKVLRRVLYRYADQVVLQTAEARQWMLSHANVRRAVVIPNPVAACHESSAASSAPPAPYVAAVGRLREEKGFDLLLRAFALTRASHPSWRLLIIGDGPKRAALTHLAVEVGVCDAVTFAGTLSEPSSLLKGAELFVLPSRFEGFPNALLEAMACGLPVISFDCPSGPRAIITPGVDGILVPPQDVPALAQAMSGLMDDPVLRARLGAAAQSVTAKYAVGAIVARWLSLVSGAESLPAGSSVKPSTAGQQEETCVG